jgi:hypothetical protein
MLEFMATDRLDEMLADFDDLKRGLISERRLCAGGDESIGDHLRALPRHRPALAGPALGRHQGGDRRSLAGALPQVRQQPRR